MFNPQPKPPRRTKNKQDKIKPIAASKASGVAKYNREVKAWKENKACACGCGRIANENHHKRGREGYASIEKYYQGISLLHDRDFWLPVYSDCHRKIGDNPDWAMKEGFTESRATNVYR